MSDCGLTNLANCLPEMFFQYLLSLITAPLQSSLDLVKNLLSQPVNLEPFLPLWTIVVYMLSMFYSFLIMYSGFNFIISGYDLVKREKAKEWLRNTIIMIVLVQASFFIYSLANDVASAVSSSALTLVPSNFFDLTIDSFSDFASQLIFSGIYFLVIIGTTIMLLLRYAIISIGVAFFPLAIFAYFIPPIKSYGSFILNVLGVSLFIIFVDAVILVGFGTLSTLPDFDNIKILLMIAAFSLIGLIMMFAMFFSIIKAAISFSTKIMVLVTAFT